MDAPLPTWTHRRLLLTRGWAGIPAQGGSHRFGASADGPACAACTRSRSVTSGRPRSAPRHSPGWATTRSTTSPRFPGRPTARWRWRPPARCSAQASRSATSTSSRCCCWTRRPPVGAVGGLVIAGVVDFAVETDQGGEHARRATAVLHVAEEEQPPAHDMAALLAAHPRRVDGAEMRRRLDKRGIQFGPAFSGLAAVHTGEGTTATVLAEVALPGQIRSQQAAYGVHPALLDACFQSVAAHPQVQGVARRCAGVAAGCPAAARLRSCPQRPLLLRTGDQSRRVRGRGRPRRAGRARGRAARLQGLRLGTGASESDHDDRVLGERLLTIEWQQRELPEPDQADTGAWLLISTDTADVVAATLADALKIRGAQCTTMCWPQHADHIERRTASGSSTCRWIHRCGRPDGARGTATPMTQSPLLARESVRHLVRIARELPRSPANRRACTS